MSPRDAARRLLGKAEIEDDADDADWGEALEEPLPPRYPHVERTPEEAVRAMLAQRAREAAKAE